MREPDTDETLMLRYQSGDAAAFDVLYARHKSGLYRFMLRQCGGEATVDELFQEVWMNVIQAAPRYRPEAQFRTWLFTLAHHRMIDHFRRHARAEAVLYEANDGGDSTAPEVPASRTEEPQVRAEARQAGHAILAALESLPAPQREAFLLYEEGGMALDEIASATGTSFETAKSRLRYAVAKLRAALRDFA